MREKITIYANVGYPKTVVRRVRDARRTGLERVTWGGSRVWQWKGWIRLDGEVQPVFSWSYVDNIPTGGWTNDRG